MSISGFQRALSDMTLDTRFASSVRNEGASTLETYELTPVEQRRLVDLARQRAMDLNCTLSRGNRFAPIVEMYPLTCELLKDELRGLLDELWSRHRPDNYQLAGEDVAFAEFLSERIRSGQVTQPYADEVFRYEAQCVALAKSLRYTSSDDLAHENVAPFRHTHFRHDPRILLRWLERREVPPPDLPEGDFPVRITLRGDSLHVDLDSEQAPRISIT
jgi:hypothetical protein